MKQSQLYVLIAGIFIAGSFIAHSIFASISMILFAIMWMVFALKSQTQEHRIARLHDLLEKRKFEFIIAMLDDIRKKEHKKVHLTKEEIKRLKRQGYSNKEIKQAIKEVEEEQ